jgi:isochorismate synthase
LQEQVFFCLPGESKFHHWIGDISVYSQSQLNLFLDKDVFLIKPFYGNELYVLIPTQKKSYSIYELPNIKVNDVLNLNLTLEKNQPKADYISYLIETIHLIKNNQFDKIVTARKFNKSIDKPLDISKILTELLQSYPNAFITFLQSKKWSNWLGASPEILFKTSNKQWQTVAVAGTREKHTVENWGQKEIIEHNKVVEYIHELLVLNNIDFSQSEVKSIAMGNIEHLVVTFTNATNQELSNNKIAQLINSLSPTPAVSGFPKSKAVNYLSSKEIFDRELYAGFIGPVINHNIDLYVNLRCCKLTQNQISYYAGGGINSMSDPESEWNETNQKIELLQSILEKK